MPIFEHLKKHRDLGIWRWDFTTNALVWSPALYRTFGLNPSESAFDWASQARFYSPDSFKVLYENLWDCMESGEPFGLQLEGKHASGKIIHLEAHGSTIYNSGGDPSQLYCLVIDRSGRQQTKDELVQRNVFLEAILKTSMNGHLIVSPQGRKLHQNERFNELLGIPPEVADDLDDARQVRWVATQVVDPHGFYEKVHHLYAHPEEKSRDEITLKNGRVLDRYSAPTRDANGNLIGRIWTFHDMTEKRRKLVEIEEAKDRALSADRAKSEFLAVMSHEFRTPLNCVQGYTDLILNSPNLPAEIYEHARVIHSSGNNLLRILDDILRFSQKEEIALENTPLSLSDLAWGTIKLIEQQALSKSLLLEVHLEPGLPSTVIGDGQRIQQVLLNLLENAVKFSERGTVRLRVGTCSIEASIHRIRFSVEDTGPGIPAGKKASIFLPFTQADSSCSRRHEGTGLGLAIAQKLVQRMGGNLVLESQEGSGSVFSFELLLPCVSSVNVEDLDRSIDLGRLDATFADRFPSRLLLVEDNTINLKLLVRVFSSLGYKNILTAVNGLDALSICGSEKVDVIFMDLQMPEMDGLTATKMIREWETVMQREDRVFITALTANVNPADRRKCFELGMDQYLSKPVNTRALCRTIAVAGSRRVSA